MKKIFLSVIIIAAMILPSGDTDDNNLYASKGISIDEIELPPVNSLRLDNGLRILYITEDLPRLTILVSVGFGKLYENKNNAGISDLLVNTLSLSGSKKYPKEVLHNAIENIGGRFEVQSFWENTQISIEVLDRYAELAFDIIEDMLLNPNIDQGSIENARSLLLEGIRRKQDNPEILAFEKLRNIIFEGDGYGVIPSEKTLKSISTKDLENIIHEYFCAKNIIIGISSPLNFTDMKKILNNRFKALKNGQIMDYNINTETISSMLSVKAKYVYLLPKDIPQATIVIGTIAPNIKDNKIYSLTLMDYILGGGDFTSRLMHEIRVKRGLAYAAQSVIRFRKNTGVFIAFVQTNNESSDISLQLLMDNIEEMAKSKVKDKELKLAKDSIKNSYIFEFATPSAILNQYIFLSYNELQESFLSNYIKNIMGVAKSDIQNSAAELFKNGLIKVVVGKKNLAEKLKKFGKVVVVNE